MIRGMDHHIKLETEHICTRSPFLTRAMIPNCNLPNTLPLVNDGKPRQLQLDRLYEEDPEPLYGPDSIFTRLSVIAFLASPLDTAADSEYVAELM